MAAAIAVLALSLAFPFFNTPKAPKTPVQIAELAERSLVRLTYTVVDDEGKPQTHVCAGFVVSASRGIAMTAEHCVDPHAILYADDQPTHILKLGEHLALVAVPRMERPPLEFRRGLVSLGESLVSVGFGYGTLTVAHRGMAGYSEGYILTDGPLYPGMSGGPVLDVFGEVVGINQKSTETFGLACQADEMIAFLR